MTVYVDDMRARFGRMIMCHMLADTDDELHAMADRIGVARRWHQKAGTPHSHYDICRSKRSAAVRAGAIECDRAKVAAIIQTKRATFERGPAKVEGTAKPTSGQERLAHTRLVAKPEQEVPTSRGCA